MSLAATANMADVKAAALSKATIRAAQKLGLRNRVLASVIGLSEATISRMSKDDFVLSHDSKSFELSAMFVRLFRGLDAIVGGDETVAKAWLANPNTALGDSSGCVSSPPWMIRVRSAVSLGQLFE